MYRSLHAMLWLHQRPMNASSCICTRVPLPCALRPLFRAALAFTPKTLAQRMQNAGTSAFSQMCTAEPYVSQETVACRCMLYCLSQGASRLVAATAWAATFPYNKHVRDSSAQAAAILSHREGSQIVFLRFYSSPAAFNHPEGKKTSFFLPGLCCPQLHVSSMSRAATPLSHAEERCMKSVWPY